MTVLIVDDNVKIRSFIKSLLTSWGYSTIEADDGKSGVELFIKNTPDIVLLDITMKQMAGIEAAGIIRQNSISAKIIMVTDHDNSSFRRQAKDAGADDYLLKENLLYLREMLNSQT